MDIFLTRGFRVVTELLTGMAESKHHAGFFDNLLSNQELLIHFDTKDLELQKTDHSTTDSMFIECFDGNIQMCYCCKKLRPN